MREGKKRIKPEKRASAKHSLNTKISKDLKIRIAIENSIKIYIYFFEIPISVEALWIRLIDTKWD